MTPRSSNDSHAHRQKTDKDTVIVDPHNSGLAYVKCSSCHDFQHPASPPGLTPEEVNSQHLNLNLGLPIEPENQVVRKTIRFFNQILLAWYEQWVFAAWNLLPTWLRRKIAFTAWVIYLPIHKLLFGRRTGIHPAASEEYHALTSVLYWGRFFPVTVERMRFSLSQLSTWTKSEITSHVETIQHDMGNVVQIPDKDKDATIQHHSMTVNGLYVHSGDTTTTNEEKDKMVLFWIYGGAFLAGDTHGNCGPADLTGRECGLDVFLPSYRLLPESEYDDMLWDIALAYAYLVLVKKIRPSNIILLGVSSGAALATQLMQFISEMERKGSVEHPSFLNHLLQPTYMPNSGVLICPFVDFTEPSGSFAHYHKHDLIVNQSVMEVGLPYIEVTLGDMENRRRYSPCYGDFTNLPDLCVVVSEHEVVYDQTITLVNRARQANVKVTVGVWKYMCHVFCFFAGFCPEGQHAMEFVHDFLKSRK